MLLVSGGGRIPVEGFDLTRQPCVVLEASTWGPIVRYTWDLGDLKEQQVINNWTTSNGPPFYLPFVISCRSCDGGSRTKGLSDGGGGTRVAPNLVINCR